MIGANAVDRDWYRAPVAQPDLSHQQRLQAMYPTGYGDQAISAAQAANTAGNPFFSVAGQGRGNNDGPQQVAPVLEALANQSSRVDARLAHDPSSGLWAEPDDFAFNANPTSLADYTDMIKASGRNPGISFNDFQRGYSDGKSLAGNRGAYNDFRDAYWGAGTKGRNDLFAKYGLGGTGSYYGWHADPDVKQAADYAWVPDWQRWDDLVGRRTRAADGTGGYGGVGHGIGPAGQGLATGGQYGGSDTF